MATKCITTWTGLSIFEYQMKKIGKTDLKKKLQILVTRNSQSQVNFHHFLFLLKKFCHHAKFDLKSMNDRQ